MENNELDNQDLRFAVMRLPASVKKVMEDPEWHGKIFVGGGYIRAIVAREELNDIDLFVPSAQQAELLAYKLCKDKKDVHKTENAYTIRGKLCIQIIHRWVFDKPQDVSNSFDFTICCAVISYNIVSLKSKPQWLSFCDERFYIDLASKRLIYRKPIRNEDAGGSMLRVLKYYAKGYRIPLDSLGAVISRLMRGVDMGKVHGSGNAQEEQIAKVVTGLLRVVDPNIDPLHEAHLPSQVQEEEEEKAEETPSPAAIEQTDDLPL